MEGGTRKDRATPHDKGTTPPQYTQKAPCVNGSCWWRSLTCFRRGVRNVYRHRERGPSDDQLGQDNHRYRPRPTPQAPAPPP